MLPVNNNCIQYCTDNQLIIHLYIHKIMTIHVTALSMCSSVCNNSLTTLFTLAFLLNMPLCEHLLKIFTVSQVASLSLH